MSAYSELKQVSLAYAMQAMTELAIPRGSRDKVLVIPVRLSASDYGKDKHYGKDFTVVVYRPMNYCFVGMIEGSMFSLEDEQEIHYETYHDSCWRDGIERMVREVANKIYDKVEKDKSANNLNVLNSFGISSPKVVDGNIIMNDSERTAKFTKKTM